MLYLDYLFSVYGLIHKVLNVDVLIAQKDNYGNSFLNSRDHLGGSEKSYFEVVQVGEETGIT